MYCKIVLSYCRDQLHNHSSFTGLISVSRLVLVSYCSFIRNGDLGRLIHNLPLDELKTHSSSRSSTSIPSYSTPCTHLQVVPHCYLFDLYSALELLVTCSLLYTMAFNALPIEVSQYPDISIKSWLILEENPHQHTIFDLDQ